MSLGWQCPVCGAVYSPTVASCQQNHSIKATASSSKAPAAEQQGRVLQGLGSSSKARAKHSYTSEFEAFWEVWGTKVGKLPASKRFAAARAAGADAAAITAGAARYAAYMDRRPELTPKHAEGWLNDERWNDVLPPSLEDAADAKAQAEMERTRRDHLYGDEDAL